MSVTSVSLDIFAKIADPTPFRTTRWQNHGIVVMTYTKGNGRTKKLSLTTLLTPIKKPHHDKSGIERPES